MAEDTDDLLTRLTKVTFLARMGVILTGVAVTPIDRRLEVLLVVALTFVAALGVFRTEVVTRVIARHPIVIVVDILLAGLVAAAAGAGSLLALYALSTAVLIGIYLPCWLAAVLTVVLIATFALASLLTTDRPALEAVEWTVPVAMAVIVLLGWATRRLHEDTVAKWRTITMLEARSGRQSERLRLARDMHDSVAKSLHGIQIAAATLPRWIGEDPQKAARRSEEIAAAATHATAEARMLLEGLRESELSFAEIIQRHMEELESGFNGTVRLEGAEDPRWEELSAAVLLQIDLVLGELLENIRRHSQASQVVVAFASEPTWSIRVEDDGVGFEPARVPSTRFGLMGAHERLALLDGELRIDSAPGRGTRAHATIPLCPQLENA
ncbi:sensor histidine kinase [uncultured Aeromicrobium sp.]|uniref:sensor histidine kinase n=1 Tax=uncultured Aeromicrobium sp. TaxID=337820 RepID=UPI0025EFA0D8|nr:histidine kinase [uncultured Aeromicrobium sp.]